MSQSKKRRGQILNCQQNYFDGERISMIKLEDITPENKIARKAKEENGMSIGD